MKINLDMTRQDVEGAIADYIQRHTGIEPYDYTMILETKSKQNYRSEWEEAEYRVKFTVNKESKE